MWFSLSAQTTYFFASIVFGAALSALYDLLCAARLILKTPRIRVVIGDVIFFALCGIFTSIFALPFNKGSVRSFIVFGEAVGFLCYRLTIGSLMGRFYAVFARGIRSFFKKICEMLKYFFNLLLKAGAFVVYNISELIDRLLHVVSARHQKHKVRRGVSRRRRRKKRIVIKRKSKGKNHEHQKDKTDKTRRRVR